MTTFNLLVISRSFTVPENSWNTVKTKPRFGERYAGFGHDTKTGVVRILVIFQDRTMFSHIIQKV